jgi:threonine dehydrogenase-like Zn-dependent dehydrogenase
MLDEVMITGAHVANRNDIKEIVSLLEMGKIDLKPMVTHTFDFANIHEGFETLRNQKGNPIRIVIKF